jgi:uncharacterized protein YbaR (Trm112 family)
MDLLTLLICPACQAPLTLDADCVMAGDHVERGALRCAGGHEYPILNRVPRFVHHALDAD